MALSFTVNNEEVKLSPKYSIVFCIVASILQQTLCRNSTFQPNVSEILFYGVIYFFVLSNIQVLFKLGQKYEFVKSLKMLRTMPKLCAFLAFGVLFHALSTTSSSFIEEEHQLWYYLNNTSWILLYLMETRHLVAAKPTEKPTPHEKVQLITRNQLKWLLLLCGNLVARRLNQTGDKWLNIADIGDWLQMEEHRVLNSLFVSASLLFVYLTCMDFGSILTNVLTITACMLIYYYRTLVGSVYFAGIKASG